MNSAEIIAWVTAVGSGLLVFVSVATKVIVAVLKKQFEDLIAAWQRMPSEQWFADCNEALKQIPSKDFLNTLNVNLATVAGQATTIGKLQERLHACEEGLVHGRTRMNATDQHLNLVDKRVVILEVKAGMPPGGGAL
jgi:hypothetical protein